MAKIDELLRTWRGIGPVEWCESKFGWIGEDARPIKLTDWQHADSNRMVVIAFCYNHTWNFQRQENRQDSCQTLRWFLGDG